MAFNIIAESNKKLDFTKLHEVIYQDNLPFDFIPMPQLGISGGDAMGICVPMKNTNEKTWELLKPILKKLNAEFGCSVYDLYGGQKLGLFNIDEFKENFLL